MVNESTAYILFERINDLHWFAYICSQDCNMAIFLILGSMWSLHITVHDLYHQIFVYMGDLFYELYNLEFASFNNYTQRMSINCLLPVIFRDLVQ